MSKKAYQAIDRLLTYMACAEPRDKHSRSPLWFDLAEPRFTEEEKGELFPGFEDDFVFDRVPISALDDGALDVTFLQDGIDTFSEKKGDQHHRSDVWFWVANRFRRVMWSEIQHRALRVAANHFIEVDTAIMDRNGTYQTYTQIFGDRMVKVEDAGKSERFWSLCGPWDKKSKYFSIPKRWTISRRNEFVVDAEDHDAKSSLHWGAIEYALGVQFNRRYTWHVKCRYPNGPAILLPTDPMGARELLREREPGPSGRRDALLHWVRSHYRKSGRLGGAGESKSLVQAHMRGKQEVRWGDLIFEVIPSQSDLERLLPTEKQKIIAARASAAKMPASAKLRLLEST